MVTRSNQTARGNTLDIPHSIHLLPGEKAVMLIRRSRVLTYRKLFLPALLLVLVLIVAFHSPISESIATAAGVIVLALLVWMILIYINYRYNNICLLTSRRIIDIKRSRLLIRETRKETEYDNIHEVKAHYDTLFEHLFRIGKVDIETLSNSSENIHLSGVDRPLDIQDKIYLLRDRFEQRQYRIRQQYIQNLLAAIAAQTRTGG